jgi:multidrug transporter EmrE-like cation transporter
MNNIMMYISLLIAIMFGSSAALFLKLGSEKFKIGFSLNSIMAILRNWKLILGLFLYATSTVFFIYSLKLGDLSIVYPLTSVSYIFITILSVLLLKEKINTYKIIGISFIVLGVILVTRP